MGCTGAVEWAQKKVAENRGSLGDFCALFTSVAPWELKKGR